MKVFHVAAGLLMVGGIAATAHAADACIAMSDCIDNGVPTEAQSCQTANPDCTVTAKYGLDSYAVTAGELADRATRLKGCGTKTFKTRGACNACFSTAEVPLELRTDGSLFHGILARAIGIMESARKAKCSKISK